MADEDDCCGVDENQIRMPGYRRALLLVVILNVVYGVIELFGGFLANSQALKADALDFLGDGSITFLGLLAIGWSLVWRARSALIQGVFLGLLGFWVIVSTILKAMNDTPVEAGLMGLFAVRWSSMLLPSCRCCRTVTAMPICALFGFFPATMRSAMLR